jgi:hypothetical protein
MQFKTKYGPAAFLMDASGAKFGVVKKMTLVIKDGDQAPTIIYEIHGNGNVHNITEAEAIQLVPKMLEVAKVETPEQSVA